jgi:hypothetical protein
MVVALDAVTLFVATTPAALTSPDCASVVLLLVIDRVWLDTSGVAVGVPL